MSLQPAPTSQRLFVELFNPRQAVVDFPLLNMVPVNPPISKFHNYSDPPRPHRYYFLPRKSGPKPQFPPPQIEELGRLLSNLCTVVPGGLVCFFPSFAYADHVTKTWETLGILASIRAKKAVLAEPRTAAEVESTLDRYKACIVGSAGSGSGSGSAGGSGSLSSGTTPMRKGGAVLLSVVGGKMSEGINFSDDMGRCVVMVGLPYPSRSDPELLERIQYLERGLDLAQLGLAPSADGGAPGACAQGTVPMRKGRGHEYYENLCMKAVNQSIGGCFSF